LNIFEGRVGGVGRGHRWGGGQVGGRRFPTEEGGGIVVSTGEYVWSGGNTDSYTWVAGGGGNCWEDEQVRL